MNVIECPEFRRLLCLLRQDLKDSDIPHPSKLRELICQAWQEYFVALKKELAVSAQLLDNPATYLNIFREPKGKFPLRLTLGQMTSSARSWRSLHTGYQKKTGV